MLGNSSCGVVWRLGVTDITPTHAFIYLHLFSFNHLIAVSACQLTLQGFISFDTPNHNCSLFTVAPSFILSPSLGKPNVMLIPSYNPLSPHVLSQFLTRLSRLQCVLFVCPLPSFLTCWRVLCLCVSLSLPLFAVTYQPVLGGRVSVPWVTVGLWSLHRDWMGVC